MAESSPLIEHLRSIAAAGMRGHGESVAIDAWRHTGLERGRLHELFAHEAVDAGAAAGFALALALAATATPILWLRTDAAERREGGLYATGLAELGLAPGELLLGRLADEASLLRAAADAGRCAGLGTLLIETWGRAPGLDLTATRRLMLAAEASGVTMLSLRIAAEPAPSAAASRWGVSAAPSRALAADAPGAPAFDIICERRRGGPAGQRWRVEWDRDTTAFRAIDPGLDPGLHGAAPVSGAGLSLVADRAAARDPAAPVRRAG